MYDCSFCLDKVRWQCRSPNCAVFWNFCLWFLSQTKFLARACARYQYIVCAYMRIYAYIGARKRCHTSYCCWKRKQQFETFVSTFEKRRKKLKKLLKTLYKRNSMQYYMQAVIGQDKIWVGCLKGRDTQYLVAVKSWKTIWKIFEKSFAKSLTKIWTYDSICRLSPKKGSKNLENWTYLEKRFLMWIKSF